MLKGCEVFLQPLEDPNPKNEDGEDGDFGVVLTLTASEDDLTGEADNLRYAICGLRNCCANSISISGGGGGLACGLQGMCCCKLVI